MKPGKRPKSSTLPPDRELPAASLGHGLLHCLAIIGLLAGVALIYGGTLSHALLNWDDQLHLTQNPYLQPGEPDRFAHFWREPYAKLYVPITYNTWAWLYGHSFDSAGVFSPWLVHAANVLAHGIATVLVYWLLVRLLSRRELSSSEPRAPAFAAACGAALFAWHPLQVESVAWISELRGLLAADFALAGVLAYVVAIDGRSRAFRIVMAGVGPVLFVLATLCKPSVAAIPMMLLVFDRIWFGRSMRRVIVSLIPWFVIAVATLLLMRQLQPAGGVDPVALWRRPFVAGDALAFYIQNLVWPFALTADYSRTPALASRGEWFWIAWIVPIGIALLVRGRERLWSDRALVAGLALFVVALVPVLGFVPFDFQRLSTVADRYAYLAMIGPALLVAGWMARPGQVARIAVVGFLALLAWRSVDQVATWRDDTTLWSHAADVNPRAIVALANIGSAQQQSGNTAAARATFERIRSIDLGNPSAHFGLATLAAAAGDLPGAIDWYDRVIAQRASDRFAVASAQDGVGLLLARQGRRAEAEARFRAAIASDPTFPNGWNDLGAVLLETDRPAEAGEAFARALAIEPRNSLALVNRASALDRAGDAAGGEAALREAARLLPKDPLPRRRLAERAMRDRRWPDAIEWFAAVLRLTPDDVDALNELGQAQALAGQIDAALISFERAIALRPDLVELRENRDAARKLRAAS